jgi:hypothetical protein
MALKGNPLPLHNPPSFDCDLGRLEIEEAEYKCAAVLNSGRMPCSHTDEFLVAVVNKSLRGFKPLGGLVGIIGRETATKRLYDRPVLNDPY